MINSINYKGYWKFAESEKWMIPGELSFSTENGIELSGIGSFSEKDDSSFFKNRIVHGITTDGKKITLINCRGGYSISVPGLKTVKLYSEFIIIGDYFNSLEEIKFDTVAIHYYYLDEWVNRNGFELYETKDSTETKEAKALKYTQPDLIELFKSDQKEVLLWFSSESPFIISNNRVNAITQKVYYNIIYSESQPLKTVQDDVNHIKNFMTFGLSRVTVPTELIGFYGKDEERKKVQIIYDQSFYPQKVSDFLHTNTCLFTYDHIAANDKTVFKEWFVKYEKLAPVFDRYFDAIYNHYLYEINYFLNLISALETYHRRTSTESFFEPSYYQELIKKIKEALPSDNKRLNDWFKKFDHMNEVSLRNRLKGICNRFKNVFNDIEPETKNFISKVVYTRNYYTHYSEELEAIIIKREDFNRYNSLLNVLIQLCLLSELGFDEDAMKQAIRRNVNNRYLFKS